MLISNVSQSPLLISSRSRHAVRDVETCRQRDRIVGLEVDGPRVSLHGDGIREAARTAGRVSAVDSDEVVACVASELQVYGGRETDRLRARLLQGNGEGERLVVAVGARVVRADYDAAVAVVGGGVHCRRDRGVELQTCVQRRKTRNREGSVFFCFSYFLCITSSVYFSVLLPHLPPFKIFPYISEITCGKLAC